MELIYKERLLALAKKLAVMPQKYFDISSFRRDDYGSVVPYVSKHNCGTVGCALGWAPTIKGLAPVISEFSKEGWDESFQLQWDKYCFRTFGISQGDAIWEFLFGGPWDCVDNTPMGAANRILYMIETDGYMDDLHGYRGDDEYTVHPKDVAIYNLEKV